MTKLMTGVAVLAACHPASAGGAPPRPLRTFSIVARDQSTGELGVAVQSHWFSVGSVVPWAEAGVGVVATQSFADPSYGQLGLALMRAGKTARQALDALLASDPEKDLRQVAMLDAKGDVAAHTGVRCIEAAGHLVGTNYSVQANLMLSDRVWPAMASAFENAEGELADRLFAALEAAQAAGGDLRGKQSAAILVVKGLSTGRPWDDRKIELRVEDSPEPLAELRRLMQVHRAYQHMNEGDAALARDDLEGARREYGAAEALFPDSLEMKFWHAVALANAGRTDDALLLFREAFSKDPSWATLLQRLPASGALKAGPEALRKILSLVPGR